MNLFEQPDFPKGPKFPGRRARHTWASEQDDPTDERRFGRVGRQRVEDRGALSSSAWRPSTRGPRCQPGLAQAHAEGRQALLPVVRTDAHAPADLSPPPNGAARAATPTTTDALLHLDDIVGKLLRQLDEMGVATTRSQSSRDNGVNLAHWPSRRTRRLPRRRRARPGTVASACPCSCAGTGHVPANDWTGEFMSSEDWLPR